MKKLCLTAVLALFSAAALPPAVAAEANTAAPKAAPKKVAPKKKAPVKKKPVVATAKEDPIPEGAEMWRCANGEKLDITGNMKRDAVLTMSWKGKNYKLPRQETTTGADRFYDAASGLDLVVIPAKAMLFSKRDHGRLADECMTHAMSEDAAKAPTQSNALLK